MNVKRQDFFEKQNLTNAASILQHVRKVPTAALNYIQLHVRCRGTKFSFRPFLEYCFFLVHEVRHKMRYYDKLNLFLGKDHA